MALHFPTDEFERRIKNARRSLQTEGLDALLVFGQESHYYLSGYDTSGYVFFQCLVITANDEPLTLLTRRPDLEQARRTSVITDIRIWYDQEGKDPSEELFVILGEKGLKGKKIGIERDTFGLLARNYDFIRDRLDGWATLVDGSHVIRRLRLVKSPLELDYVRTAAGLADNALEAMTAASRPGAFEGTIMAAGSNVIFEGGGDPPPSGPVLGSGERALLVRSSTGYRNLDPVDQLTIEFAATYRRYNVCLMRTLAIGKADDRQRRMFDVTRDALAAMTDAARPGRELGEIDTAHRKVFDDAGFGHARMSACGYSLGATYRPSWMDVPPMLYEGNPEPATPGMVLFLHAILIDAEAELAMSLGHTVVVRDGAPEVLSGLSQQLTVCD